MVFRRGLLLARCLSRGITVSRRILSRRMSSLITKYPSKVELHIHLDGAIRPETVFELAKQRGITVPAATAEELRKKIYIHVEDESHTLVEFLQKFQIFVPPITGDLSAIKRIAYEFCEDCQTHGIIYAEARYCPHLLANSVEDNDHLHEGNNNSDECKISPEDVVRKVNEGFAEGCRDFNVKVKSILSCMRHKPDWSSEILELCKKFRDDGVVGIDIAGDESLAKQTCPAHNEHVRVFQEAEKLGIFRTVHAGESGTAENVREAIEEMHANRIGHGYHALDNPEVYKKLKNSKIHLETCPSSSFVTNSVGKEIAKHPCIQFMTDNVNFSINTDDPIITDRWLEDEYEFVQKSFNFTDTQIIQTIYDAANAAFLPDNEKKELIKALDKDYQEYKEKLDIIKQ